MLFDHPASDWPQIRYTLYAIRSTDIRGVVYSIFSTNTSLALRYLSLTLALHLVPNTLILIGEIGHGTADLHRNSRPAAGRSPASACAGSHGGTFGRPTLLTARLAIHAVLGSPLAAMLI